jgi:hypothetical protein
VIKFISCLPIVGGSLRVLWPLPPLELCHVLGFDTSVSDWSVGNMNSDVISNGMLLHVSALPTKKKGKEKGTILIRLCYMIVACP